MAHKPTAEQAEVIKAFTSADRPTQVVQAGAGCGKSSTLKMAANAQPSRRGIYIAYNKALADEAKRDFPASVTCRTAHSLAYGPVGSQYKERLSGPRVPAAAAARALGLTTSVKVSDTLPPMAPKTLARATLRMVNRFLNSADHEPGEQHHVPVDNYTPDENASLAQVLAPYARKAWADLQLKRGGQLQFTHDCYLKLYQLSRPAIPGDFIMLDEAQDLSPVMASLFHFQDHAQRVMVGDSAQAIYGFRGAIDAMAKFQADIRLTLSQSFRFGQAVADEANRWLTLLRAPLRLTGLDSIPSVLVDEMADPDAVLVRSNAGAIAQVMQAVGAGKRPALVGGGKEIEALARAAQDLMDGRGTAHPELLAFTDWDQVVDYASNDEADGSLKVLVKLIEDHGPDKLIQVTNGLVDEKRADVVISTAHKAKGREWDRVQIGGDFREPRIDEATRRPKFQRDELMLAYVAVTRARKALDRGSLAWIDDYAGGKPAAAPAPAPAPERIEVTPAAEPPPAALDDAPELGQEIGPDTAAALSLLTPGRVVLRRAAAAPEGGVRAWVPCHPGQSVRAHRLDGNVVRCQAPTCGRAYHLSLTDAGDAGWTARWKVAPPVDVLDTDGGYGEQP